MYVWLETLKTKVALAIGILVLIGPCRGLAQNPVDLEETQASTMYVISEPKTVAALDSIVSPQNWTVSKGRVPTVPTRQQALELLNAMPNMGLGGKVCDLAYRDATNDALYELIVVVDLSRWCNGVYVVRRESNSYRMQVIRAGDLKSLSSAITDLDGDGVPELVVPFWYATGKERCPAEWTAVYQWDGNKYAPSDSKFPSLYRKKLDTLNGDIRTLESDPRVGGAGDCDYMERDRILRFLHDDPKAGLERAKVWAKDKDAETREWAIAVFAEIDDPEAERQLQMLARDEVVGKQAMAALAGRATPAK